MRTRPQWRQRGGLGFEPSPQHGQLGLARQRPHAFERRQSDGAPPFGASETARCVGVRRALMKVGEECCQAVDVVGPQSARGELLTEQRTQREASHTHRVLQYRPRAVKHRRLRRTGDTRDAQVQRRRQPPVQPHFLFAKMPPRLQGAVIDEEQLHRLLDLVGGVTGQQHPGNVRFRATGRAAYGPLR
ncbi:hypothetical protein LP414_32450 [Polaromonas sp. P1(28)-13]|nr:hypothetical protein LP414_32450 [Polaromonas sp. P1(28)-13]